MNVEDMVPELFVDHRIYFCQRCLNHGQYVRRKNHKVVCPFGFCNCYACQMVDKRRELNSLLIKTKSDEDSINSIASNSNTNDGMLEREVTKERMPRCQRCAQHNVHNRLKGHKRTCPFLDCHCAKCQVVLERQRLMADQIKLRRRQKKQKKAVVEHQQTPSAHGHMQLQPFVLPPLLEFRNEHQGQYSNSFLPDMHSRKILEKTPPENSTAFCLLSILRAQNFFASPNLFMPLFPPTPALSNSDVS